VEEIFEEILQTVPFLTDPLIPLSPSLLLAMPGTPEASHSFGYPDSGIGMSYFDRLDDLEDITQEQRDNVMDVRTIITDSKRMKTCVSLRGDIWCKFDRLHKLLLREPLVIMNDIEPIGALIGELVDDLGDLLPATSASALVDVSCLADLKEKYLRVEERCRRRDARGPVLVELNSVVTRLEGAWKAFKDTLTPKRSAHREVKVADHEVADLRKHLADAESRAASAREKLHRVTEVRDRRRAEGEALYQKYEELRSAVLKIPGNPETDEDFLHQVNVTLAKALAVIVGADAIMDSRRDRP